MSARIPSMFRDSTKKQREETSDELKSLTNIGKVLSEALRKVDVQTASEYKKIGWQEILRRLIRVHPRYHHLIYAKVLIGAEKNLVWTQVSAKDVASARKFLASFKHISAKKKRSQKISAKAQTKS